MTPAPFRARALAWYRVAALLLSGSALYVTFLAIYGPLHLAPRMARRWRTFMYGMWARSVARLLGMRAEYRGVRPEGRFIVAANHTTYADIAVLARRLDVAFVAKSEVRSWPFIGALARSVGTIFVDRTRKRDSVRASNDIERALAMERSIAFFPEGGSSGGEEVLPFKPALLEVAAANAIPVYGAAIHYRTPSRFPPAEEVVCWGDDTSFATHIVRLLHLPYFHAVVAFGPPRISDDRKELAQLLWNDVSGLFEMLRREARAEEAE